MPSFPLMFKRKDKISLFSKSKNESVDSALSSTQIYELSTAVDIQKVLARS